MDLLNRVSSENKNIIIPKFTNIDNNLNEIISILNSINKYKHENLVDIVYNSYETILNDIFLRDKEMREEIIEAFNNETFVKVFVEVMSNVKLTDEQYCTCNRIAWDYIMGNELAAANIRNLFSNLVYNIDRNNKNIIDKLSVYIPIDVARLIAMARYSSLNNQKCAARVNNIIYMTSIKIDVQTIVNMYGILYKHIGPVFEAIMYDIGDNTVNINNYNNVTTAIFCILENMSNDIIRDVLYKFALDYMFLNKANVLRVNIRKYCIDNNYARIVRMIDYLNDVENVKIP